MRKLFIWDYHGTLERGNEDVVLEYTNLALERMGYQRRLTREENLKLYGIAWYKYFEYLLPEETHQQHLAIQDMCLKIEHERPETWDRYLKPNDGLHEVVSAIHASIHDQIIISNTEEHVIGRFVNAIGLDPYFPEGKYFATNTHLGARETKHDKLKRYLIGREFDHFVAIGDGPKDLEYVQEYPNTTYLYAHPGWKFRDYPATYRIHDLREVLKEL